MLQNSKKNRHSSVEYFASLEGKTAEKLHLKFNATRGERYRPIDPKGEKKSFVTFPGGLLMSGCVSFFLKMMSLAPATSNVFFSDL